MGSFLTGRQCDKIVHIQLPWPDMGFRRPEFVPYYARKEWSAAVTDTELDRLIAAAGFSPVPQDQIARILRDLAFGEAAPLAIRARDGGGGPARSPHRKDRL